MNAEQLCDGLLLMPNLDAAFDNGYISFSDDGCILVSDKLCEDNCKKLGISRDMRLRTITNGHRQYLAYHRRVIFLSTKD